MPPYAVYLHSNLLDSVPKTGVQRRKILEFIRSLGNHPGTMGDFAEQDETLREHQVKIVGDYAIVYWLDAPVRIVMITEVRPPTGAHSGFLNTLAARTAPGHPAACCYPPPIPACRMKLV
jgi:hypothetical protein